MITMNDLSHQPLPLDLASWELMTAKQAEEAARLHRIACEEQVITLVGLKPEGTQTVKTDYFKVATVQSLTRSLTPDGEALIEAEGIPIFDQVVRYRPEVSVSGLKALATANPAAYARVIKAIVTKPGKPAVKVEPIEGVA